MNYAFSRKIGHLKQFYKVHLSNTQKWGEVYSASPEIAQPAQNITQEFIYLLGQATIVMLYSIWEGFVEEIKTNDPKHYHHHFNPGYELYYDDSVKEVANLRHCIVHNRGVIDEDYIRQSPVKAYKLGEEINLLEQDIDIHFGVVEQAFNNIIK